MYFLLLHVEISSSHVCLLMNNNEAGDSKAEPLHCSSLLAVASLTSGRSLKPRLRSLSDDESIYDLVLS